MVQGTTKPGFRGRKSGGDCDGLGVGRKKGGGSARGGARARGPEAPCAKDLGIMSREGRAFVTGRW